MTKNQSPVSERNFIARSTIGAKLIKTIVLTSGVALMLASIALITHNYYTTRDQMVRDLKTLSQVISDNSAASLIFEDRQAAAEIMSALKAQPYITDTCLYDGGGAFFADYRAQNLAGLGCPETVAASGIVSANGTISLTQSVEFDSKQIGFFLVRLRLTELTSQLITYCIWVLFIGVLSLVTAFILSAFFQCKITGPLLNLVNLAQAVTQKQDNSVRAGTESDDAIGQLMAAFNEMLATVEERDQALTIAKESAESKNEALQREVAIRRSVERQRDQAVESLTDAIESMSEGFAVWNSDDRGLPPLTSSSR